MVTEDVIVEALREVYDPELHYNIYDLGLVYDITIADGNVGVLMTLTTPACPYGDMLIAMVNRAVEEMDEVEVVEVKLVWDPPWDPNEMCSDGAKDILGIW